MVLRGLLDAEKSPARFPRYPEGIRQTHGRSRFHPVYPGRISTGLVTSTRDCDDFDRGGRPLFLLDCSRRYAVDRSHANRDDAGLAGPFLSTFTRHIFVCTNQRSPDDPRGSCSKLGSEALHAHFKQEAKRLDLKDIVRANKAGCLDHCAQGPSVVIYPEGVWYQVKSKGDVTEIMERHVIKGEVVTRLVMPDHPVPTMLPPLKS